MMETAKYILENESGERFDLTAPADIYMVNVEGLGATSNIGFANLQNGFFRAISDEQPQNGITGDLIYRPGAYRNYELLIDWIFKAKKLYFCYTPLSTEYRKQVKLNYIEKDRRDSAGWMRAAISFLPLTPWYVENPSSLEIRSATGNEKAYYAYDDDGTTRYGFLYSDDLVYGSSSAGEMTATIAPTGHDPAGFVLRYYGAISSPVIRLVGMTSGETIGICDISGSLSSGDILELSTVPDDCHVWKISGNTVTDLVMTGAVDLAKDPYPKIPVNEQSTLSIESSATISGNGELTIRSNYRSV